jgi:hypothetical protein
MGTAGFFGIRRLGYGHLQTNSPEAQAEIDAGKRLAKLAAATDEPLLLDFLDAVVVGAACPNAREHVAHGVCGCKDEEDDDQGEPDLRLARDGTGCARSGRHVPTTFPGAAKCTGEGKSSLARRLRRRGTALEGTRRGATAGTAVPTGASGRG